jgi:hypothetical protein
MIKSGHSSFPSVKYHKPVSDTWLKRFLSAVAAVVGGDVTVHSGDRNFVPQGGARKSQHLVGRAADLKVSGFTPKQVFDRLLAAGEALPAPMMCRYQILHHGKHTATEAEHVHIGRYAFLDKRSERAGFDFWVEGETSAETGKYKLVKSVDAGEGSAAPFEPDR